MIPADIYRHKRCASRYRLMVLLADRNKAWFATFAGARQLV
jgi:hypothetical protein